MNLLPGNAPSRLIANTTLVVTVKCEKPPRYTFIARITDIVIAPHKFPLKAILKMLITGYEVTPFNVSEILPFIAYNSPTKKPSPVIIAAITP